jgi:hypothetical protein
MKHTRIPLKLSVLLGLVAAMAVAVAQQMGVTQFRTVESGTMSRIERPVLIPITSDAAMRSYFQEAFGQVPATLPTGIDWNREMLLAVHLGERRTGGYTVEVMDVRRIGPNELSVQYAERPPAPGATVTMALTHPWTLVRVERPR